MRQHKWLQILNGYSSKEEVVQLLKTTTYVELAKRWGCSVDCVYTLRKKLGLGTKRTDIDLFLKTYSRDVLEDLYFNKYDRHLQDMADGLNVYIMTLSNIFKRFGIVQQPHHVTEYPKFRKMISKRQKELAKISNPIERILNTPDWSNKSVQARQDKGSYTSPEYRAKISKKHVEVLARGEHKFQDTDIEILMQKAFSKQKIKFKTQKNLLDLTCVDIFIKPNIVVFCDGDYWHNLPAAKVKDPYINEGLRRAGYKVFRFLGSEIKSNVSKCIQQVVDYINSPK